jgi:hypothetical protein
MEKVLGQNQITSKVYNTTDANSDEEDSEVVQPILAQSNAPSTKMTSTQSSNLGKSKHQRRGSSISLHPRPLTNSEQ